MVGKDMRVMIFGDFEDARLLDSYLTSRIRGLIRLENKEMSQQIGVFSYEDLTGKEFDKETIPSP